MFTKVQATIYNGSIDGVDYQLILQGPNYELLQVELGYEEGGDAESGPRMYTYVKGYQLIAGGCGGPNGETESAIEEFVRCEIQYFHAHPAVVDRHLI